MTPAFRIVGVFVLAGLLQGAVAQETPRLARVLGEGEAFLFGVAAAAASGFDVAVLTDPEPAVHVFRASRGVEWGREGRGPAELIAPSDIAWRDGVVAVLDMQAHKIVSWTDDGGFLASRSLGGMWARRLAIVGPDTLVETFVPMGEAFALVRLGAESDTLLAWSARGESIRLEAAGAPSLTVRIPFTPQVRWTVLADGTLVWFDPAGERIRWCAANGRSMRDLPVTWKPLAVEAADRSWWMQETFSAEFQGRRIFEPLAAVARERVAFAERLPVVMDLMADGASGFWVRRSSEARGERWMLVGRDGAVAGELRLPAGRRLLAVSGEALFALATDELDVETVEVYERPTWAIRR